MLAIGALLLCSTLLAFAALSHVCNRPVPPRWSKLPGAALTITMIFMTVIVAGLASLALAVGAVGPYEGGIEPVDLGMVALVLAGTAVVWRWLSVRHRAPHPPVAVPVVAAPLVPGGASGLSAGTVPAQPEPAPRAA